VRIPDFDSYVLSNLTYAQSASLNISDKLMNNKNPVPVSLDDFYAGGGVYNIQGKLNETAEGSYLSLVMRADTSKFTGAASAIDIPAEDIIKSGYFGLTMSADKQCSVSLMLSAGNNTYIGETTVSRGEKTYFFDISAFAKKVKASEKITVSVCILPCGDDDVSLEIRSMSLYGSSGVDAQTVTVIVVVAVIILALLALIVLLVVKRKKKAAHRQSDK
jgi:tetrahydromethanopterin S-methyltransferase subunit B